MATISVRMDDKTKSDFENFCSAVGLTVSSAINMFAKKVVNTHKIPFTVSDDEDPFWSEENQAHLRKNIQDMKNGVNVHVHDLSEVGL